MSNNKTRIHTVRNFPVELSQDIRILAAKLDIGVGVLYIKIIEDAVKRPLNEMKKVIKSENSSSD